MKHAAVYILTGLFVLAFSRPFSAVAQSTRVSGTVVDARTGTPLPGANVFVANTTRGDAAGPGGAFSIEIEQAGQIELVASMIGYETQSRNLTLEHSGSTHVSFALTEHVFDQREAVVTAERPKHWKRNLERFTRELLGTSENAEACEIKNPHVLDFFEDPDAGTLQAFAQEPLRIENRALGYDLIFVLDDFQVSSWPYTIRYRGRPRFTKRETTSETESQAIEQRRRAAYLGSMRHFLVALTSHSLEEDGFDVRTGNRIETNPVALQQLPRIVADSMLARGQTTYERLVYAPNVLHVVYHPERESGRYRRFVRDAGGRAAVKKAQTSYLMFDHAVTVHTTGYSYNPYAVTTHGYWTWERLADTLPRDYRPD